MAITINGTTGVAGVDGSASTPAVQGSDTNTGVSFGTDTVNINTGGSTRATVDSAGRFLIGTTTEGVSTGDTFTIATSSNTGMTLRSGTSNEGNIFFSDGTSGADEYRGSIQYNHGSNFLTIGTDGSERMRIDSSGNVIIGGTGLNNSAVSGQALQITGTDRPTLILRGNASGSNTAEIQFADNSGSDDDNAGIRAGLIQYNHSDNSMRLRTNATERMRIDSNGRVCMNNTAAVDPSQLAVKGAYPVTPIEVQQDTANNHYAITFRNSNGLVGNIITLNSGTTYNTSSDYRLKENAVAISDGITRLKSLKPYRFNFKVDTNTIVDGFFAHEVTPVVPEAITGTKDEVVTQSMIDEGKYDEGTLNNPIHQGIDQSKLVPLLTAALQEAVAKIETLETKVAALEAA